jgi:hypothetical protein
MQRSFKKVGRKLKPVFILVETFAEVAITQQLKLEKNM